MPQPFKPKETDPVNVGPRCIEKRPKCAVKIAAIARAWTAVEGEMASLFGWVTGETAITAPDTVSHKSNFVAQASLRAIQSLATRISVFRAATETVLQPAQKEEFEKLIAVLRKRAGERNDVVHGQWCTFDRFPDELLLNVTTPTSGFVLQRYTEADLEQIIVRILELRDRLHHFGIDCVMNRVMHHEQALQALAALKPPPLGE